MGEACRSRSYAHLRAVDSMNPHSQPSAAAMRQYSIIFGPVDIISFPARAKAPSER